MKHLYAIIFLLSLGLLPRTSWGQGGQGTYNVLFGFWAQENPVVTATGNEPYEIGSTTGSVGLVTLQRGSGGTVGDTLSNSFIASGWLDASLSTAESNARYFSFDVPPDPETIINIQSLAFYLYRSPTGPSWYQWEFSTNGFTTPGTRIGDSVHFTTAGSSVLEPTLDLSHYPDLQYLPGTITSFRLYAWGAVDSGGIFGFGANPGASSIGLSGKYISLQGPIDMAPNTDYSISGFTTVAGTPSASQQTSVGADGIFDSITVTAPAGYEVSLDNSNFFPYLAFYPTNALGDLFAYYYFRISSLAPPGPLNAVATLSTRALPTVNISLNGTVNAPPPHLLAVDNNSLEFGNAATGNTVDKKITLSTNNLTANITVTANGKYQVSTDSAHFGPTATIGRDTADNKTEPLFIRFTPDADNLQFNDSLRVSVATDTTLIVRVKGNSLLPASTVNMTTWNLNYFGTQQHGYGAPDKIQQINNVKTILPTLHSDVFALQEIVSDSALAASVSSMPGYAYALSNFGALSNPFDPNHADSATIPRLAFVYNTAKVRNVRTEALLSNGVNTSADVGSPNYINWNNGRYPFMLTADVDLDDDHGGTITKTIRFINIHAQDNSGDMVTAYNNRVNAAFALDTLIKNNYSGDNVIVLGEFNDDLNHSIVPGKDTSSFIAFLNDSAVYQFPTKILSMQQQRSNANFTGITDNMIINNTMSAWYLPSSAIVLSQVSGTVPLYNTSTAGYYPVSSGFSFAPPIPLPEQLPSFTGTRLEATAKLSWTTSEEINTASFDIQRSGDNQAFTSIGTVVAQGNKSTTTDYTFTDASPLNGNNYYRLKMVDLDGKSTYSKTVLLNFGSALSLHISPNPAHGTANLFVGNASDAFSIQIVDLNGQTVKQFQTIPGTANIPIDVSSLAKGIYTVKVISATAVTTQKLLVQ